MIESVSAMGGSLNISDEMVARVSAPPIPPVLPLADVVRCWKKQRKTVELAILKERLDGYRVGRTWLLYTHSVVAIWGEPKEMAVEYVR